MVTRGRVALGPVATAGGEGETVAGGPGLTAGTESTSGGSAEASVVAGTDTDASGDGTGLAGEAATGRGAVLVDGTCVLGWFLSLTFW